jgi:hypothetical protein
VQEHLRTTSALDPSSKSWYETCMTSAFEKSVNGKHTPSQPSQWEEMRWEVVYEGPNLENLLLLWCCPPYRWR